MPENRDLDQPDQPDTAFEEDDEIVGVEDETDEEFEDVEDEEEFDEEEPRGQESADDIGTERGKPGGWSSS